MGLVSLPWNIPSSWAIPYHPSFMEKFEKKNTFEHKSKILWENERVDPVVWFPELTVKVIWQNASSPALSNKHQDMAWLAVG
eukprot:g17724.t1